VTPYIAEFYNTLSSVPIVLFALTALYIGFHEGFRTRFLVPCLFTALVGVGSIAFHGTLQYWGQAMDELFMVYAATAYMCMIAFSDRTIPARFVVPAALALDAAFTGAYVYLRDGPFFVVFCVIFGLLSTWLCYASLQMHRRTFSPILQRLFWAGQLTWLGGFGLFWFPDKLACEYVQRFHLHAWFHLCVATAPLLFLTHATHCFYSAELAVVTGKVSDNAGKLIPAPPEVLRYISERALREHIAVDVAAGAPKTIAVPQLFWSWIPVIPVSVCARARFRLRSTTSALHHTNPPGRFRSLSNSFTSRSSSVSTTSATARISPENNCVHTRREILKAFPFSPLRARRPHNLEKVVERDGPFIRRVELLCTHKRWWWDWAR
jgi:dihydroceramidase